MWTHLMVPLNPFILSESIISSFSVWQNNNEYPKREKLLLNRFKHGKNDLFKSGVDSKAPNTYSCYRLLVYHWLDWQYVRLIDFFPLRILGRLFFSIFSLVSGKMMTMSRHDFHIPHSTKKKWGLYLQQHEHVMMTHWKKKLEGIQCIFWMIPSITIIRFAPAPKTTRKTQCEIFHIW